MFLVNARTLAMASLACAMVYLCESGTLDYQWVKGGGERRGGGARGAEPPSGVVHLGVICGVAHSKGHVRCVADA